jgi:uncharacterized protein involved in copper resistance
MRQDFSAKSNRTYAAFGIEGLAPFSIEIDADAFVSQKGEVSAPITAFHDLLITNRLILQPRIDLKLQAQRVPDLDLGSGFTLSSSAHGCAMRSPGMLPLTSALTGNGDPVSSLFFVAAFAWCGDG